MLAILVVLVEITALLCVLAFGKGAGGTPTNPPMSSAPPTEPPVKPRAHARGLPRRGDAVARREPVRRPCHRRYWRPAPVADGTVADACDAPLDATGFQATPPGSGDLLVAQAIGYQG